MELLITVAIIGVLSAISLFAIADSRKSARDARRKADLESIRSALELYRADCGVYAASPLPDVGNPLVSVTTLPPTCPTAGVRYLEKVPGDPATGTSYRYDRKTGNVRYALCARLEEAPVPTPATADVSNCGGTCPNVGGSNTCNYVLYNP